MDEQNKNNDSQNWCGCPVCRRFKNGGNYHWGKHLIIKKLLVLAALLIAFCVGVKVGELKAMLKNRFYFNNRVGSEMMQRGVIQNGNTIPNGGMMPQGNGQFFYYRQ